jgi:uncharacterized protein YhdP
MSRLKKKYLLLVLVPVLVVGILGVLFSHYLFDPDLYKKILEESLTASLGREVTLGKAEIRLWGGPGLSFENLRIRDRSQPFDLFLSKRVILKVRLLPLLKKEVKWKSVHLEEPKVHLLRDKDGRFNVLGGPLAVDRLKTKEQKLMQSLSTLFGGSIVLENGSITFTDETMGPSPLITDIRSFHLRLSKVSHQKPFPFHVEGKIGHSTREATFSVKGTLQDIPEDMDFSKGKVHGEAKVKGLELSHFWPYLKPWLPMKSISGSLEMEGRYQGNFSGPFNTAAKIRIREVLFDYPQVFSYLFRPKYVRIDAEAEYDLKSLTLPRFSVKMPEIEIRGKGRLTQIGSEEMGLEAEVQSNPFDLSDGRKFIPYRIIIPEVSQRLFHAEGSGQVQILSAKLKGKLSEIEHCDQPPYAHVLTAEVRLNGTFLKLPWDLPPLEELKGRLLYRDGHLRFKEIEGRVLHSRIDQADGTFYQLLQVPTLETQLKGQLELTDLPAWGRYKDTPVEFAQTLSPFRIESGKALTQLSFKTVLKAPLHFKHQGSYHLSRVRLYRSQLPFPVSVTEGKVDLSNEGGQGSDLHVAFLQSSLLMKGAWKWDGKSPPFEIFARGRVDLRNLLALSQSPLFPEDMRSKWKEIDGLSGTGQLSFKGQSTQERPFAYDIEVTPKEGSMFLKGVSSPLVLREGTFAFSDQGVSFSNARVRFGSSSLMLDGWIKERQLSFSTSGSIDLESLHSLVRSPLFSDQAGSFIHELRQLTGKADFRLRGWGTMEEGLHLLREGEVRFRGVSLQHRRLPAAFSSLEGTLLVSPGTIRFVGMKGKLGDSPVALTGSLSRFPPPHGSPAGLGRAVSFQLSSPQLDFDSLFTKRETSAPLSFLKIREWLSTWSVDGTINIDRGKFLGFSYRNLKGQLMTTDGKLVFYPFQFEAEGGDLWGQGWVEPTSHGIQFEIQPRLSNMEAQGFLRAFIPKRDEERRFFVTGRVHIDKVVLTGEGEDFQKVKESLDGKMRIEFINGVIEKFNILAKIFSVLNVSQLFKGRIPDLTTRGLPYRQIKATIAVKDGVASTEDFLVDSDAIKITIVGKVDLGRNWIDARVGVHPLGTVDTVLSSVPIAGYILTGKDKAFISVIYEVKGDLNDPEIHAIPVKGLGEGFLGILQRLLETPFRPFQKLPSQNDR